MIERIGSSYLTSNIEAGEYSYVVEAGSKAKLEQCFPDWQFMEDYINSLPYSDRI